MRLLLFLALFNSFAFAQRYHIDQVVSPNDSITFVKSTMQPLTGLVNNDYGEIGYFLNGRREGLHKSYFMECLESEVNYHNGLRHGRAIHYYEGFCGERTFKETNYINGIQNGLCRIFHSNGNLHYEYTLISDSYAGRYREWYENGQLKRELFYRNYDLRTEEKKEKEWYSNGLLKKERIEKYIKDTLCVITSEYLNGAKYSNLSDINPLEKKHLRGYADDDLIIDSTWHGNGQLESVYRERDGNRESWVRTWHDNGQLKHETFYLDGKKSGLARSWSYEGDLEFSGSFEDGKEEGLHRDWFRKQLIGEVNYKSGKRHGSFKEWHFNGQLRFSSEWENGVTINEEVIFYNDQGVEDMKITFDKNGNPLCQGNCKRFDKIMEFVWRKRAS